MLALCLQGEGGMRRFGLGLLTAMFMGSAMAGDAPPAKSPLVPAEELSVLLQLLQASGPCPDVWISGERAAARMDALVKQLKWPRAKAQERMTAEARAIKDQRTRDPAAFCETSTNTFLGLRGYLRMAGIAD